MNPHALESPVFDWKERRAKVGALLPQPAAHEEHLVYLAGHVLHERPYTDVELPFRQESNFWYLTGVQMLPGCHFVYAIQSKRSYLFLPFVSDDDAVWVGAQTPFEEIRQRYQMDHVSSTNDIAETLKQMNVKTVYHLKQVRLDILGLPATITADDQKLSHALAEVRIVKSEEELRLMRIANRASSDSHQALMQFVRDATSMPEGGGIGDGHRHFSEREVMAKWYADTYRRGCVEQAYLPIVAYGPHAATLHYNRNDGLIPYDGKSFLLVDAGAEYRGYASDITRTYPISGRFETEEQKGLYSIVLAAQMAVLDKIKAGVAWEDLHRLAVEVIGQGLLDLGILKSNGSSLKDLCWKKFVVQRFLPHGLGHLIGMDVHDVGGYPPGVERIQEPGTRYLRLRRVLQPGYVVTVEPGCYFIDLLIEAAKNDPMQSPHLDVDVLELYRPLGGVRIEDCVVVTANGHENLTSAPKTIADIEKVMSGMDV